MGSSSQKQTLPSSKNYEILDYGYCKVWKRKDNHQETMQQYQILIQDEKTLECYKQMWFMRSHNASIVNVYYFSNQKDSNFCGFSGTATILTQRIPYRLSQFCNMPYSETIFILKKTLQAFKHLNSQYGLFKISSTMIGVTQKGDIKVWHHTDYSSALPQNPNCQNLKTMIDSLVSAVESTGGFPFGYPRFSSYLAGNLSKYYPGFSETLQLLEKYCTSFKIKSYESLTDLKNYVRELQGFQSSSFNHNFLDNISKLMHVNQSTLGKYQSKDLQNSNQTVTRKQSFSKPQIDNKKYSLNRHLASQQKQIQKSNKKQQPSLLKGSLIKLLNQEQSEETIKQPKGFSIYTSFKNKQSQLYNSNRLSRNKQENYAHFSEKLNPFASRAKQNKGINENNVRMNNFLSNFNSKSSQKASSKSSSHSVSAQQGIYYFNKNNLSPNISTVQSPTLKSSIDQRIKDQSANCLQKNSQKLKINQNILFHYKMPENTYKSPVKFTTLNQKSSAKLKLY